MNEWFAKLQAEFILNFVEDNRWKYLVTGLVNTLKITLAAVLLGIVIGTLVAIIRSTWDQTRTGCARARERRFFTSEILSAKIYLTVIRGTPVVVQLMIMFYIIFATSRNGVGVAMLAFGVNSGAYVAELIRGGIMAIDRGSWRPDGLLASTTCRRCALSSCRRRSKKCAPGACQRVLSCSLKETSVAGYRGDRPYQGRRYHPGPDVLGVHAAHCGGADLSRDGRVLYMAGREIGEEASQQ